MGEALQVTGTHCFDCYSKCAHNELSINLWSLETIGTPSCCVHEYRKHNMCHHDQRPNRYFYKQSSARIDSMRRQDVGQPGTCMMDRWRNTRHLAKYRSDGSAKNSRIMSAANRLDRLPTKTQPTNRHRVALQQALTR